MKASDLKRYLRIYWLRIKASTMVRLAYPLNFFILFFSVFLQAIITIIFIKVIYSFIDNISGWSYDQALLVVASFLLVEGLMWITTAFLSGIRKNVKQGTFDQILVKPLNPLFAVSTWRIDPEDSMRVVVALYIFARAASSYHFSLFGWICHLAVFFYFIFAGYLLYYSITLMINSLFFWYTEAGNIHNMLESVMRAAQYPTDIFYGRALKTVFSSILPLAFLATVPAKVFTEGIDLMNMAYAFTLVVIFLWLAGRVWHAGLAAYSSASS